MAISKSTVRRTAYQRQPMSTINDGVKTMWYTQRNIDESARKYVRLHPEGQAVFVQYFAEISCRLFTVTIHKA